MQEAIFTATAHFYCKTLPQEVKEYLMQERGLTGETIERNKIGYAPTSPVLLRFLEQQGYTKSQAVEAGILYEDGREYFSGCTIFPNWHYGKVVYITGRGWPEKSHKKPLKDKLPLKHLFWEQALREKEVIIAEGETDTYTLRQAGFNACGIFGTGGFQEEWTRKFSRVETVYIALDGDEAGRQATLKLAELFKSKAQNKAFGAFRAQSHTKDEPHMLRHPLDELPTIGPIAPDQSQLFTRPAAPGKQESDPLRIRHRSRRDDDEQHEAQRVNQDMAFAPVDLFAFVIAAFASHSRLWEACDGLLAGVPAPARCHGCVASRHCRAIG